MSAAAQAIASLRKRNERAWELAVLASTAVQVEPELLRRLRVDLVPYSDASAEADLWLSDLIDSKSPDAAVLRADVRAELQQDLAADSRRDAAAAIIAELHAEVSDVIQLQEQVTALSLRNDAGARREIDQLLQPVVRTLHESDHPGLARWAARAFAQLPPAAQRMPVPWSMVRTASLRLRGAGSGASATGTGWSAVESSLRGLPLIPVYVRLSRDRATITTTAGEGARLDIPATEPLLLELAWDGPEGRESGRVVFSEGETTELPLLPRGVAVTTLLGDEYEIRVPPQHDHWAITFTNVPDDVTSDAMAVYRWIVDPAGGAVPAGQSSLVLVPDKQVERRDRIASAVRDLLDIVSSSAHRRLYVCVSRPLRESAKDRITAESLRIVLEPLAGHFEELIILGEIELTGSASSGGFLNLGRSGLFLGFEDRPGQAPFAPLLAEALFGNAAGDDGVLTAQSLTSYLTETVSLAPSRVRWQSWGGLSPLLASDDFAVFVEFRSHLGPVGVRIRDHDGEVVLAFELGAMARRRLLRGRYSVDVPERSLLLRFETSLAESEEPELEYIVDVRPDSREEWIIIAGTAGDVTESQQLFAAAFARRLAGAGYRLLVGDWRGVDTITIASFTSALSRLDISPDPYVRRVMLQPDRAVAERIPGAIVVNSVEEEFDRPIREAHAIVLIGGLGGTYEYAVRAAKAGVPILPIAPTGGDAITLYHEYLQGGSSGELYEAAAQAAGAAGMAEAIREAEWQRGEIRNETDADEMAMRAVELLLDHLPAWRKPEEPRQKVVESSPETGIPTEEVRTIVDIITAVLPPDALDLVLRSRFGHNLEDQVSPGSSYPAMVLQIVRNAVAQDWFLDLIVAVREARPRSPELAELAARYGAAITPPSSAVLGRVLAGLTPTIDVTDWQARLAEVESRVCRIELHSTRGPITTTGFLVGPRAVMTVYHLVGDVVRGAVSPREMAFRFDIRATGGVRDEGRLYHPADDWLIDSSPYGDKAEDLDYAVLRLSEPVGDRPVATDNDEAPRRGWIDLPTYAVRFPQPKDSIFVVYSTPATPMKLAFGSNAVLGFTQLTSRDPDSPGRQLEYRVNTALGAAGAPCFDVRWNLVAMHESQTADRLSAAGVSMHAIAERLRYRGMIGKILN